MALEFEKNISSVPSIGLNMDDDPSNIKDGEYTFALNAITTDNKQNEMYISSHLGNKSCTTLPSGYIVIGKIRVVNDEYVLFLVNPTNNQSEIGILKDCIYTTIINDPCLNFVITNPIKGVYKQTYNCGLNIYWTDNLNPRRYMNLNAIPYKTVSGTQVLDCDLIKINKNITIPQISVTSVTGNGSLKSGSYQFFLGYADSNNIQQAGYFDVTNIVPIIHDATDSYWGTNLGCDSGLPTNKSIILNFSNVDTQFTYLILGQIYTINGVESYSIINYIPTKANTYSYTGSEVLISISGGIQEIFAGKQKNIYDKAKDVQDVNNYLFWGSLTGKSNPNYQPFANNIQIKWFCNRVLASNVSKDYKNPISTTNSKGLLRDEVYALGIVLVYKDGSETCAYHIPGRPINNYYNGYLIPTQNDPWGTSIIQPNWDDTPISSSDINAFDIPVGQTYLPRWKVYNSATIDPHQVSIDYTTRAEGVYNSGYCAYFEIDSSYPNTTYVDNNGINQRIYPIGNIRHHKMPDCLIAPLITSYNTPNYTGGGLVSPSYPDLPTFNLDFNIDPYIDILNISASNVIIPQSIINLGVVGYKLVYSKRDENNKTIESKGLLYNSRLMKQNGTTQITFNYPYNQSSIGGTDINYSGYNFTTVPANNTDGANLNVMDYISPTNLNDKFLPLSPTEFKVEMKLEGAVINIGSLVTDSSVCDIVFSLCKYNNNLYPTIPLTVPSPIVKHDQRRKIKNAINSPMLNGSLQSHSQTTFNYDTNTQFKQGEISIGYVSANPIQGSNEFSISSVLFYCTSQVYYVSLKRNKYNIYSQLDLINYEYFSPGSDLTNFSNRPFDSSIWLGGDTFISFFSTRRKHSFYNKYNPDGSLQPNTVDNAVFDAPLSTGSTTNTGVPTFWCETPINTEYRYLDSTGSPQSDFWPHTASTFSAWLNQSITKNNSFFTKDNVYVFNPDLSKINIDNFICSQSTNPVFNGCITNYNTRVIYSEPSQVESLVDNWLIEKINNYYDFPKNKGSLIAINQLDQSKILFRFQDTCYVSAAYDVLQASNNNIEVGTGGIFASEPKELSFTDLGYGGSQHQLTFNSTQFGHFFIDQIRKKVYSMGSQLNEISKNKMFSFFKNNMDFKLLIYFPTFSLIDNYNNPNGLGFNGAFDTLFNVWYLSKKDYIPNPTYISGITMLNNNFYYNGTLINLTNSTYFTPCSFTIGYSPLYEKWISFYSFIPDEYLQTNKGIKTIKNGVVYDHFDTNIFTTYYGTTYDHIIEYVFKYSGLRGMLRSFKYNSCVYQYTDSINYFEIYNKTYYKFLIYNQNECTGYLYPLLKNEYDLSTIISYNNNVLDSISNTIGLTTAISRRENIWQFNDLFDRRDKTNLSSMFSSDYTNPYFISAVLINNSLDKELNQSCIIYNRAWNQLKNLNNSWFKCRMFYKDSLTKIVNKIAINDLQESIR